jgi:hypothetical protein
LVRTSNRGTITVLSTDGEDVAGPPASRLPIDALLPADSPRLEGEDEDHVRALAEVDEELLPPVVVHRATMRVIDGMHRLRALELRGVDTVRVRFHDRAEEDLFVLAVQHNIEHGLPLSLADRTAAAARILGSHPHWSDRKVASVAALSAGTVRTSGARSTADAAQSTARLGRDGRRRPVSSAEGRILAGRLLEENPDMPLRQVATAAGISPSTALDVRDRVRGGQDPVPAKLRPSHHRKRGKPAPTPPEVPAQRTGLDWESVLNQLRVDPSLRFTDTGRLLLRLFDARLLSTDERAQLAVGVPSHCTMTVAHLARVVGAAWHQLASDLEQRERASAEDQPRP